MWNFEGMEKERIVEKTSVIRPEENSELLADICSTTVCLQDVVNRPLVLFQVFKNDD